MQYSFFVKEKNFVQKNFVFYVSIKHFFNSLLLHSCAILMVDFSGVSAVKESACSVGDLGLMHGLGRSPGEENGYPPQHSGLENSMDCVVHGVTKSQTWLRNFHFTSLTMEKTGKIYLKWEICIPRNGLHIIFWKALFLDSHFIFFHY